MSVPLPWLTEAVAALAERRAAGRFPHALLLSGQPGVGKGQLATAAAHLLLCERPSTGGACGECRGCTLLAAGSHPDLRAVRPEEGKKGIGIDQIRTLAEFLLLKSQYAGYRVGIIEPADRMSLSAANSLLKTLEEPPPGAVLILVAQRPAGLPATIRSRCQQLSVPVPAAAAALAWLRAQEGAGDAEACLPLAGGAPLLALTYAREGVVRRYTELLEVLAALRAGKVDVVTAAGGWSGQRELLIRLLLQAVADLVRGHYGAAGGGDLRALGQGLDLVMLHEYLDKLLEARRQVGHPLNEQLVLEQLFIDWCALCRRSQLR